MKKFLTYLLTAALLATASTGVFADDVAAEPTDAEAGIEAISLIEPLVLEGMTQIEVTTADSNLEADVANFFDSMPETACVIAFPEDAESKTFSVYTATRVPEALAKFAAIVDGEKGTVLTFEVYATNDSLLLDWTPLAFGPDSLDTEYAIFAMADATTDYAFYRFDFTVEVGDYFELAELVLFELTNDDPEMMYDIQGDVVELDNPPALIPVPVEEAEEADAASAIEEEIAEDKVMEDIPTFGLFSKFPMPVYKFLPRG